MFISQYFYGSTSEEKQNIYKDVFLDVLSKRRNKFFTVYALINSYSLSSKKKIEDILLDKNDIQDAINFLKTNENIIIYYYCKGDKIYYIFEYSINPLIKQYNIEIPINDNIDNQFNMNITIDIVKNIVAEPKKYINFCPVKNTINNSNLLKQIVLANEDKLLNEIINKYNISITDSTSGCGIKYKDLLEAALSINNAIIVNIIDKCYYEKKCEKIDMLEKLDFKDIKYKKYYQYLTVGGSVVSLIMMPYIFYLTIYIPHC